MKRFIAATLLGCASLGLSAPAHATDMLKMSDGERAVFGAEVRAYLLENPEIIIEAVQILEERRAAELANSDHALLLEYADQIYNDGASYVSGNPDGDLTIVEFSDYNCGYCKRSHPIIEALLKSDGNIRLITKEFPVLGPDSVASARFAIATLLMAPETYPKVKNTLMSMRGKPSEAALMKLAAGLGLDGDALVAKMASDEVSGIIENNHMLGQNLRISGTPAFILGDQIIRGSLPLETMQALVQQARQK